MQAKIGKKNTLILCQHAKKNTIMENSEKPGEEESRDQIQRAFRKGNINFDFLRPEERHEEASEVKLSERRQGRREGKRGMFNRGRLMHPVGPVWILVWGLLMVVSTTCIVWIFLLGRSAVWLLTVPFLLAMILWSMIMIALLKARPR